MAEKLLFPLFLSESAARPLSARRSLSTGDSRVRTRTIVSGQTGTLEITLSFSRPKRPRQYVNRVGREAELWDGLKITLLFKKNYVLEEQTGAPAGRWW